MLEFRIIFFKDEWTVNVYVDGKYQTYSNFKETEDMLKFVETYSTGY